MIHHHPHQARPAQVLQAVPCLIQMIRAPHHHLHRQIHHHRPQAANRQIHPVPAQALAQVLNPLTAAKNTTNQNHLH